ncbi:protein kinase domain-containing protein [Streptomyces umbrinus]|uniref:serine/threonine-protein kinase n=1 Tax=Streptomyces umbrinus TaxID=67370 RepID=UPI003F4D86EE
MSSGENQQPGEKDRPDGPDQPDGIGRLLVGRYRVVAQLGRGGMGVVWRALDEVLGREVAVKELRTYSDAGAPELADLGLRMQREARAAARVRHPGVVAVHDVAEVDGRPLIVMELVDGPSLDDVLRERGTLDAREVAGIGAKVMDALSAAHRAGVLHRDVKPGNILLDRSGRVVLTDFGIATMDDPGDGSATHLTRSGELVGSLDYLAPERAQGHEPGPASDIWALGATLYAAVEGASPFRRTSTWSTLTAIVVEPLPEPQRAGPLGPVLQQLMHKQPESRPDAGEASRLLQAVADATTGTDSATTGLRPPAPRPREATERSVPAVPPGFGPPESGGAGFGPAGDARADAGSFGGSASGAPATGHAGFGASEPSGAGAEGSGTAGAGAAAFGAAGVGGSGAGASGEGWPGSASPAPDGTGASTPASAPASASASASEGSGYGSGFPDAGPTAPGSQQAGGHGTPPTAGSSVPPPIAGPGFGPPDSMAQPAVPAGPRRRKGRVLLAAAAVTVVLAATGVTVALMNGSGESKPTAGPRASQGGDATPSEGASRGSIDLSDDTKPTEQGDKKESAKPSEKPDRTEDTKQPTDKAPAPSSKPSNGGTTGGGSDGGTTGGGGEPSTAPVCHAIGGGKYNCEVWKTSTSYTAAGAEAGTLNAGTNYFYCQQNLGRRETYGEWTNVWWAKTDDDSGNTNVFVSDVYIKGGDNDAPVPGLPVC